MDDAELTGRAGDPLHGYSRGPGATVRATHRALRNVEDAEALILVEGVSDQIAVETLARRQGRDLMAEGLVVLPVGGAQAIGHYARRFGPLGQGLQVRGMCDADAVDAVRSGLARSGLGRVDPGDDLGAWGFHVCVEDLEDELVRAVGVEEVQSILDTQHELRSFRTLQRQPEWRGRPVTDQLRRFLGSKSTRNMRYARLLVEAAAPDRIPRPLSNVLGEL